MPDGVWSHSITVSAGTTNVETTSEVLRHTFDNLNAAMRHVAHLRSRFFGMEYDDSRVSLEVDKMTLHDLSQALRQTAADLREAVAEVIERVG